jgi:nucleoside diphosphate kinase
LTNPNFVIKFLFCLFSEKANAPKRTICIIKPDMMEQNKKEEIIQKILERGYKIADQREVKFTEEMAREFYNHRKDSVKKYPNFLVSMHFNKIIYFTLIKPQFDELIKYMTGGVSCVLALSKEDSIDVVDSWRNELDDEEKSLRAQYATNQIINSLHGSDSHEDAIKYF